MTASIIPGHVNCIVESARLLLPVDLVLSLPDRKPWRVIFEESRVPVSVTRHVPQTGQLASGARGSRVWVPTRTEIVPPTRSIRREQEPEVTLVVVIGLVHV